MGIGTEVMLHLMQEWGQSVEKKIETLNKAVAACGIKATFIQNADGTSAHWEGETKVDCDMAREFRERLRGVWCGEMNQEIENVENLIAEFQRRTGHVPAKEVQT